MTLPTSVNVGISYESALDESKIHVVTKSSKKKAAGDLIPPDGAGPYDEGAGPAGASSLLAP